MISKEIVWTAAGDEGAQKHPMSLVETKRIGKGSTIGAFAHLLPGSVIGDDVRIHEHTYIGCDVVIGDRVVVECGARLRKGARVEADAVIGPNAVVAGETDIYGKTPSEMPLQVLVKEGATVGANATVLAGVTIGKRAVVGAGAVVTRDIPPNAVVAGNPARITGYVDTPQVGGATDLYGFRCARMSPCPHCV